MHWLRCSTVQEASSSSSTLRVADLNNYNVILCAGVRIVAVVDALDLHVLITVIIIFTVTANSGTEMPVTRGLTITATATATATAIKIITWSSEQTWRRSNRGRCNPSRCVDFRRTPRRIPHQRGLGSMRLEHWAVQSLEPKDDLFRVVFNQLPFSCSSCSSCSSCYACYW